MSRTDVRLSGARLPRWDGVLPPWPGREEAGLFVRRAPGPGGGGEPALLVHGLGGSSTNWTDLMGLLAGRLDAAAVDLPGFGRSGPPADASYALRTHVRAVVRLLQEQDRGPVHLFGNSLGGTVSTVVAARHPELVRTLTLVSPALPSLTPPRGSDPRLPLLLLPGTALLVRRALARRTPEQRVAALFALCFGDRQAVSEQRLQEAVDEVRRRDGLPHAEAALTGSLRGLVASYARRGPRGAWQLARRVEAPTLLVWGTDDRLVDVSLAPRALAMFPHSRLLVLPGVGHVAQLEQPETVARAFLAMAEDLDAPAGVQTA